MPAATDRFAEARTQVMEETLAGLEGRDGIGEAAMEDVEQALAFTSSESVREAYRETYVEVMTHFGPLVEDAIVRDGEAAKRHDSGDDLDEWVRRAEQFLAAQGAERVRQVTSTTRTQIRRIMRQAIREGLSMQDAARRLQDVWPAVNRTRATTIARTEIISSSNASSQMGAEAAQGRLGRPVQKEWISTFGPRTRDHHAAAHGQTVPLDQPFIVMGEELMYAGDPAGSARNVINCRCTSGYVVVEN